MLLAEADWFSGPLNYLGLELFSRIVVLVSIAAIISLLQLVVCILTVLQSHGARAFVVMFAACGALFAAEPSPSVAAVLVAATFVVAVGSAIWICASMHSARCATCVSMACVWLAFWFVTSGLTLTL